MNQKHKKEVIMAYFPASAWRDWRKSQKLQSG